MNISFLKKTRITKFLFFFVSDIILISGAIFIAFLMRFEGVIPQEYFISGLIIKYIFFTLFFCLPVFYFFRLYSFSWSYVSTNELISLFKATTISFIFLGIIIFFSKELPLLSGLPRSVFIIDYFLVFILCGGVRIAKRVYLRSSGNSKMSEREKTLIVGAGDAGEQILRSIISSQNSLYNPVAIVDDNNIKQGVSIHGLKVLGKISDIPDIIIEKGIKQMIVALPSAGNKIIKKVVELGRKSGIQKIKIMPALSEIMSGQVSFNNLKDVEADDLLGREPVTLDTKQIEKFIKDKIILITGAAGSIGSELSRQVAKFEPASLALLDQDETGIFNISNELLMNFPSLKIVPIIADITDKEKINEVFKNYQPKIIFHAAAYKHVPLMEDSPDEAVKNNIFGTKIVAEASISYNAEKFILISTDKAVNPVSVMGSTKRVAEMLCQTLNQQNVTKFISVRFGNVLDSRGSVIPIFREQIKKGGPVTITHPDMKRYFMLIPEACILVLQAGAMGNGGEVFVLDMGEYVKIIDLAKEMIKLSGYEPDKDIAIVFTGIRPGEKLFEEILTAEEGTVATQNKKIFKAKLSEVDSLILKNNINKLNNLINGKDKDKIKQELKLVVLQSK
ncbi:MAG: nucleoside-diphosphate sugar epimerase/dehydratase [Candidatus Staskawiczbacteria bacterium]|jgi:FlaA1/EpsC-like NDP-sugar epimerase